MPAGRPRKHPRDTTRISALPSITPSAVAELLPHVLAPRKMRLKTRSSRARKSALVLEQRRVDGVMQWVATGAAAVPSSALAVPTPPPPPYANPEPAYVPVPRLPGRRLPPGPVPLPDGDGLLVSRGRMEHVIAGEVLMDVMTSPRARPRDRVKAAHVARSTKHPTEEQWQAAAVMAREADLAKLTREEMLDYVEACDAARAERLGFLLIKVTPEMEEAGSISIDLAGWSARKRDRAMPMMVED
jgi:hypothetical protein